MCTAELVGLEWYSLYIITLCSTVYLQCSTEATSVSKKISWLAKTTILQEPTKGEEGKMANGAPGDGTQDRESCHASEVRLYVTTHYYLLFLNGFIYDLLVWGGG